MPSDRLDVVIFGASGHTGKFTVYEGVKLLKGLRWGVAGRSRQKLEQILVEMGDKAGEDLTKTPIIIADVDDDASLVKMASQAKVIINCCGPFLLYGEQVIKACVEAKTHHIDVSGEAEYMETMQLKYNDVARENGVYIVTGCGFDSIPADLGVVFLEDKFNGTVNSVEVYMKSFSLNNYKPKGALINYGTYASVVHGVNSFRKLKPIREKLFATKIPRFEPALKERMPIHKSEASKGRWCLPILEMDRAVVRRSQRIFYEKDNKRPVQMRAYGVFGPLYIAIGTIFYFGFLAVMSFFSFTRNLLLSHPKFFTAGTFSREGPEDETSENSVLKFTFCGEGWNEKFTGSTAKIDKPMDKKIVTQVTCVNPGYGTTCICLLVSATTILKESSKMPDKGGVLPPAAAFKNTSMIKELHSSGVTFEVVE